MRTRPTRRAALLPSLRAPPPAADDDALDSHLRARPMSRLPRSLATLATGIAAAFALPTRAVAQDPAPAPTMPAPTGASLPKAKHQILSVQPMSAMFGA